MAMMAMMMILNTADNNNDDDGAGHVDSRSNINVVRS